MRTFIIPMVGQSKRFLNAGFSLPKYMLYLDQLSLFNLSVSSFKDYFQSSKFIFVARDVYQTKRFIEAECDLLNLSNFEIIILDSLTKGQAESVYLAIQQSSTQEDDEIYIFNIDSYYLNFNISTKTCDGYLDVFNGPGDHWSFAKTDIDDSDRVIETVEKIRISEHCSTGLYYFKSANLFNQAYLRTYDAGNSFGVEYFIAPLYNYLIENNGLVLINKIEHDDIRFCGTPTELKQTLIDLIKTI